MDPNKPSWSEWFSRGRTIEPDELSFRAGQGSVTVVLRNEPSSKSLARNLFYGAILVVFAGALLFRMDQLLWQITFAALILIMAYAYTARTRIAIETDPLCLVAETRHFGRTTGTLRLPYQKDAHFVARPVGGYQNIESELMFVDQNQSYFCIYVTNPTEFNEVLRDLNAAVSSVHGLGSH